MGLWRSLKIWYAKRKIRSYIENVFKRARKRVEMANKNKSTLEDHPNFDKSNKGQKR